MDPSVAALTYTVGLHKLSRRANPRNVSKNKESHQFKCLDIKLRFSHIIVFMLFSEIRYRYIIGLELNLAYSEYVWCFHMTSSCSRSCNQNEIQIIILVY